MIVLWRFWCFLQFWSYFGHFFCNFFCKKANFLQQIPLNQIKNDRSRKINTDGPREKRFDCRSSKWLKHFTQKCKFGTNFFSTLDLGPKISTIFLRVRPFGARPFGARWAGPLLPCVERKYWKSFQEKVPLKTTLYFLTKITFLGNFTYQIALGLI